MNEIGSYVIFGIAVLGSLEILRRSAQRSPRDVLADLELNCSDSSDLLDDGAGRSRTSSLMQSEPELIEMGIFSSDARRIFRIRSTAVPICCGLGGMALALILRFSPGGLCVAGLAGWSAGLLILRILNRRRKARFVRSLEFYLPLVMERIVMAVQAGLDVIPAVHCVVHEQKEDRAFSKSTDPVSKLLEFALRLTERGLGFERSLREVAGNVKCSPLRHAFVHLGLAQRDGGELIVPLRELSDATHIYYQESVEEEIARLPVKATLPLLCTFAGLIICFITAPIVQIISITHQSVPK